jgi:hypothetical protein
MLDLGNTCIYTFGFAGVVATAVLVTEVVEAEVVVVVAVVAGAAVEVLAAEEEGVASTMARVVKEAVLVLTEEAAVVFGLVSALTVVFSNPAKVALVVVSSKKLFSGAGSLVTVGGVVILSSGPTTAFGAFSGLAMPTVTV